MQPNLAELALEHIESLHSRGLALYDLSDRLRDGLTMELALEADRLAPEAGVLQTYFSEVQGKDQLAVEGVVDSAIEAVVKVISSIVEMIKRFLEWLFGDNGRPKAWRESEEKFQRDLKDIQGEFTSVDQVERGARDAAIDEYLKATPNKAHALRKMLIEDAARTRAYYDATTPYLRSLAGAGDYLKAALGPVQTTSELVHELEALVKSHSSDNSVSLEKIPQVVQEMEELWNRFDDQHGTGKEVAQRIPQALEETLHLGGRLTFSQFVKLEKDHKDDAILADLDTTLAAIKVPVKYLGGRLEVLRMALEHTAQRSGNESAAAGARGLSKAVNLIGGVMGDKIRLTGAVDRFYSERMVLSARWLKAYQQGLAIGTGLMEVD